MSCCAGKSILDNSIVIKQRACIEELQRDLAIAQRIIGELKVEKDEILREKYGNFSNQQSYTKKNVIIATDKNKVHFFKKSENEQASSSKEKSSRQKVDSPKANVIKKKTRKKANLDISSVKYHLRSRDIHQQKTKTSDNKYV